VHQLKQAGLAEMISGHHTLVEEFGTGNAAQSEGLYQLLPPSH